MDQIHLSPRVDQIQLTLGHISNNVSITGSKLFCLFEVLRGSLPACADFDLVGINILL
jgi:hypothetical protein